MFRNLITFIKKFLTTSGGNAEISKTREVLPSPIREVIASKPITDSLSCPYCLSQDFQRRGFRQKKLEKVQLYLCLSCGKTFTPHITKGKHYPLNIMLDAISIYNLGYSLEQTCGIVRKRFNGTSNRGDLRSKDTDYFGSRILQPSTLSNWLSETAELCRFSRMREFALKKYSPREMVIHTTLAHRQLYRYRFHRAKCELIIQEEYQHRKFLPLKEFLEMVPIECPHQYFNTGLRASEAPLTFLKTQMIVRAKQNYATKLTTFVLQSVKERKGRHEALQKFMLANDSVTVATEVPVYITRDDLLHMQTQLGFTMFQRDVSQINRSRITAPGDDTDVKSVGDGSSKTSETSAMGRHTIASNGTTIDKNHLPKLITGHVDILQIRNGIIHILDYKPCAEKERPIEQLTLYAMALSRLTGLRLFEFKCAWFDEKDYFEFYPLHVLHKTKKGARRRKVITSEGVYTINKNPDKVERIRPIV